MTYLHSPEAGPGETSLKLVGPTASLVLLGFSQVKAQRLSSPASHDWIARSRQLLDKIQ